MRFIFAAALLLVPIFAQAQQQLTPPSTPQEVPRYCQQREGQPIALLVMARDELKTPREQFVNSVSSGGLDAAGKQLMIERVNDVYDNPDLNSDTLWVFRANRCIEEFSRKGFVKYKPEISAALLQCQTENGGSMGALAQCVASASDAQLAQ
jgi:hypothetical protein